MMLHRHSKIIATPLGTLCIAGTEKGISEIVFTDQTQTDAEAFPHLEACARQLSEYFDGKRRTFDGLPLAIIGTAFAQDVWQKVAGIGFGETVTYGAIAASIGNAAAVRAVGTAVGRNPLAILIPCHRIVLTHGDVGGFAWGVERKEWLLRHERK